LLRAAGDAIDGAADVAAVVRSFSVLSRSCPPSVFALFVMLTNWPDCTMLNDGPATTGCAGAVTGSGAAPGNGFGTAPRHGLGREAS
jgi:hypothetical protein